MKPSTRLLLGQPLLFMSGWQIGNALRDKPVNWVFLVAGLVFGCWVVISSTKRS